MTPKNYSRGIFTPKNPDKYIGNRTIHYRSSWEVNVMLMCDNNPAIQKWASEPMKIPYRDPLTGRQTVYVPDFLVNYVDANGKQHAEIWEIKPAKQAIFEKVGRARENKEQYVKNMAKWEAAGHFCKQNGIVFRVITESDIFHMGTKQKRKRK